MKLAIAKLRSNLNAHHLSVLAWVGVLIGIGMFGGGWKAGLMIAVPILYLARHTAALRRKHDRQTASLHLRMIEALAIMVEAKDETTHQHIRRVAFYASALAREMGIDGSDLEALHAAALLHDIGKVAVPGHIISKPGRLTEEEFERMKIHPVVGAEILEKLQLPNPVAPMVRSHHERWDGTGYPDGLKGEGIPIGARVLAVVDAFDALTTDRPYRSACSPREAMEELKRGAGVTYDPKIVRLLEKLYPKLKELLESSQAPPSSVALAKGNDHAEPQAGLSAEIASPLYSVVQARQELQVVYELAQRLGATLTPDSIFRLLADHLQKLIPFNTIAIYVVDGGDLTPRFVEGFHDYTLARLRLPTGKGLS